MKRLALFIMLCAWPLKLNAEPPVDFNREVRALLGQRCLRCHGPDSGKREAGLRLDLREQAVAELDSGSRAIVPGDPELSELISRVSTDDIEMRMPPEGAGDPLSSDQIELLRQWIRQGAVYEQHWALRPIRMPRRPPSEEPGGSAAFEPAQNAVDDFVRHRLRDEQLEASPVADRYTLVRRLYLDLLGLPPSIEEVDEFVGDPRPDAYQRLVDRLLAAPAYGERWARIWLDLARYADSAGYAQDPPRTIWRYRDWVIQAINSNMPFDQFTIEQLAGDLLPERTDSQLLATAFHRNTLTNSEGGTDDEEFRVAAIVDRVNTTMEIWMGLTMGCAQCHNHKYDPISQEEYFRFYAILNNTADADRGDEAPLMTEYTESERAARRELSGQIGEIERRLASTRKEVAAGDPAPAEKTAAGGVGENSGDKAGDGKADDSASLTEQLQQLTRQLREIAGVSTPIMEELTGEARRATKIHVRGNFRAPGATVEPGVPQVFPPLDGPADRLSLARWLVSAENPLTARVTVNRFWETLFGRGIVETSEDFGTQGEPPSHPELLDYLASELVRHAWDTKWLVKQIVNSATYRQTSHVSEQLEQRDPFNRLLARGPRIRSSAEMIRDQALALSGLLSNKLGGPSVYPPQPKLGFRSAFGGSTDWESSGGADRFRRGLYTSWRRTTPYPSMITFDAPSREFCTIRRLPTNTPLQALVTLNDPVYVEAAQGLARRTLAECRRAPATAGDPLPAEAAEETPTPGTAEIVSRMFRTVLARPPEPSEVARLETVYHQSLERYQADAEMARAIATDPLGPAPEDLELPDLASWTVVANVVLNLDETIARP